MIVAISGMVFRLLMALSASSQVVNIAAMPRNVRIRQPTPLLFNRIISIRSHSIGRFILES